MSRTITEIARILHDKVAWGLSTVDEKGNVIKKYSVDKNTRQITIPQADLTGNTTNSGNNGNSDDTDNTPEGRIPDVGVDTDPGQFITNRQALWTGRTVSGKVNHIKLDKEITGVNGVGDGLQLSLILEKRIIKDGVSSDPSDLPLKASTKNKKIAGYFVTTSPIPLSIQTKDIIMGKKVVVPFDGIGEDLDNVKIHKAPSLSITYNADGTFDFEDQQGYYLDKTGDGNNGATYNVLVTHINNYTVSSKTELLPNGTTLWEGDLVAGTTDYPNQVVLSRVNKDLTNVGTGIKVYFSNKILVSDNGIEHYAEIPLENFKLNVPNPWIIPFSQLDNGNILSVYSLLNNYDKIIGYTKSSTGNYDSMILIRIDNSPNRKQLFTINNATVTYSMPGTTGKIEPSFVSGRIDTMSCYGNLSIVKITSYSE